MDNSLNFPHHRSGYPVVPGKEIAFMRGAIPRVNEFIKLLYKLKLTTQYWYPNHPKSEARSALFRQSLIRQVLRKLV